MLSTSSENENAMNRKLILLVSELSFGAKTRVAQFAKDNGFVCLIVEDEVQGHPVIELDYIKSKDISREKYSHLSDSEFDSYVKIRSLSDDNNTYPPTGEPPVDYSKQEMQAVLTVQLMISQINADVRINGITVEQAIKNSGYLFMPFDSIDK